LITLCSFSLVAPSIGLGACDSRSGSPMAGHGIRVRI
jgi:hypothetical protein